MPLTEMGQAALADALADPQFTIVRHKAEEMASLLSQINRLEQGGGTGSNEKEPERVYLTEADRAMLDEYRDLLASVRTISPSSTEAEQPSEETRRTYSAPTPSISELLEAYRAKANEMNAALAAMTPPAGFTPEQQRDYYAARKVASIETEYDLSDYTPTMWQCNYCGALHNTPSACVQPELGGTWIAVTPEQYIKAHGEHIVTRRSFIIE